MSLRRPAMLAVAALVVGLAGTARAHEVRPGFLQLEETVPGEFSVLWKVPTLGGLRLRLDPLFPEDCEATSPIESVDTPGARVERWSLACAEPLVGRSIRILGLEATLTDVLVRLERADGSVLTARIFPTRPTWELPTSPESGELATTYLWLGIEHILLGVDHLLFVLGLLLLVEGRWLLLKTITAFTVAHSLTLASATFGVILLDEAPVNAAIALSILFVGVEIAHLDEGRVGLTRRYPWAVAFAFGLLHGLGFASALTELGLPPDAIPMALLLFNVGVEIGQVGFVLLILALMGAFRRLQTVWPRWSERLPAYAIGTAGAFWLVGRLLVLIGARP